MGKASRKPRQQPAPEPVHGPRPLSAAGWTVVAAIAITPLLLLNGVFLSHDVMPKVIFTLACAAMLLFLLPRWAVIPPKTFLTPSLLPLKSLD